MASQRFGFSYGGLRLLMTLLGLGPGLSRIELRPTELVVTMGWGFRTRIPRQAITGAYEDSRPGLSVGIHGVRGRWIVNGSMSGIVTILVDPPCRAFALGFPVRLERLQVSAEDPEGLVAAIGRG